MIRQWSSFSKLGEENFDYFDLKLVKKEQVSDKRIKRRTVISCNLLKILKFHLWVSSGGLSEGMKVIISCLLTFSEILQLQTKNKNTFFFECNQYLFLFSFIFLLYYFFPSFFL
jgi:hypothetical protein